MPTKAEIVWSLRFVSLYSEPKVGPCHVSTPGNSNSPQTPEGLDVVLEQHFTLASPRSLSLTDQATATSAVNTSLHHGLNPQGLPVHYTQFSKTLVLTLC